VCILPREQIKYFPNFCEGVEVFNFGVGEMHPEVRIPEPLKEGIKKGLIIFI
jgi:hypothetical protein